MYLCHCATLAITSQLWGLNKNNRSEPKNCRHHQDLFRRCISVDRAIKKEIFTEAQTVFLSPLADQLTGFGKVKELLMMQYLFTSYAKIE